MLIISLELSRLQKICSDFTEEFFDTMLDNIPQVGIKREGYYIVNINLAIKNPTQLQVIDIFNTFVQIARTKCNLIQIVKPKKTTDE